MIHALLNLSVQRELIRAEYRVVLAFQRCCLHVLRNTMLSCLGDGSGALGPSDHCDFGLYKVSCPWAPARKGIHTGGHNRRYQCHDVVNRDAAVEHVIGSQSLVRDGGGQAKVCSRRADDESQSNGAAAALA